jgi:hypothetical protein
MRLRGHETHEAKHSATLWNISHGVLQLADGFAAELKSEERFL